MTSLSRVVGQTHVTLVRQVFDLGLVESEIAQNDILAFVTVNRVGTGSTKCLQCVQQQAIQRECCTKITLIMCWTAIMNQYR